MKMNRNITRRLLLAGAPILLASVACAGFLMRPPPSDLDLTRSKPTENSIYIASIAPTEEPVQVGRMHSWILTLKTSRGDPVREARVTVDGGMPQHGHGLPTAPAARPMFSNGQFQIEGLRFNMRGWWELRFGIDGPEGSDSVTFNIIL
jgi:hypothetical protein